MHLRAFLSAMKKDTFKMIQEVKDVFKRCIKESHGNQRQTGPRGPLRAARASFSLSSGISTFPCISACCLLSTGWLYLWP